MRMSSAGKSTALDTFSDDELLVDDCDDDYDPEKDQSKGSHYPPCFSPQMDKYLHSCISLI